MPLRKRSAWRNLSKFLQKPKGPQNGLWRNGDCRWCTKIYGILPLTWGDPPLFPPHLFGAEEEQKLTAALVEATKRASHWLFMVGRPPVSTTYFGMYSMYSKTSRWNYGNLMTMPHQLVKDSEKSTVAVDGA